MKLRIVTVTVLLSLLPVELPTRNHEQTPFLIASAHAAAAPQESGGPCTFPTKIKGMSDAEVAWRFFVAATCPVANDPKAVVKWEQWEEQEQVFPQPPKAGATPSTSRFHPSRLAQLMNPGNRVQQLNLETANCQNGANPPYPGGKVRLICEEVRINPEAVAYITSSGFQNRPAQAAVAKNHGSFGFPPAAIEMKMDWVLASMDLCSHPPAAPKVHVEKSFDPETKTTNCYALAGIHLNSKITSNWVWATWEPQDNTTNPRRCFELGCRDSWGADPRAVPDKQPAPPVSSQTTALKSLMQAANLAPEWFNYRMDGVQTDFDKQGNPTLLGNSVTEAESVGLELRHTSCITCHEVSSIKNDGTDGTTFLHVAKTHQGPIGLPSKWPPPNDGNWAHRDFAWSFLLAPGGKTAK